MSLHTIENNGTAPRLFGAGRFGGVTWLGFLVAALGWALLLGVIAARAKLAASFRDDGVELARCLIGSGFSLALIGALQNGFGALNRFFAAVLTRSAPRAAPAPVAATTPFVDRAAAQPLRERRPYQILADGSVEVETIVGTRRFLTMEEARDFL